MTVARAGVYAMETALEFDYTGKENNARETYHLTCASGEATHQPV